MDRQTDDVQTDDVLLPQTYKKERVFDGLWQESCIIGRYNSLSFPLNFIQVYMLLMFSLLNFNDSKQIYSFRSFRRSSLMCC